MFIQIVMLFLLLISVEAYPQNRIAIVTDSMSGIMPEGQALNLTLSRTPFDYEYLDYIPFELDKDQYSCVMLMSRGAAVSCRTEVLDEYIRSGGSLICGGGIPYFIAPTDTVDPIYHWFACEDYTNGAGVMLAAEAAAQYGYQLDERIDSVPCQFSFGALADPLPGCDVIVKWHCPGDATDDVAACGNSYGNGRVFYISRPIQSDLLSELTRSFLLEAPEYIWGDADGSRSVDVDDVIFLVDYIFHEGLPPERFSAADPTGDGFVDIDDVTRLVGYVFEGQKLLGAGAIED